MIKVKNLTKKYNQTKALDSISFNVKKGEVLGFLGPNGAGKTTTMKIITGFMASSEGEVLIDSDNFQEQSLKIRSKIGYLPENNPLYEDMKVKEYLKFVAEMREIKSQEKIDKMIDTCGLKDVINKSIAELSKGYRQRVGLAAAMLHDPEILVLDEPTSGLDPNQIVEIRKLIKKIGEQKTVILSTHILPEVQATCDRVIIINEGKISAQGTIAEITEQAQGQEEIYADISGPEHDIKEKIAALPEVAAIAKIDGGYKIQAVSGVDLREKIFDCVVTNNWKLLELKRISISLEDVFRELTTKEK